MSRTLVQCTALVLIVALVASPLSRRALAEITATTAQRLEIGVLPRKKLAIAPSAGMKSFLLVDKGGTFATFRFTIAGSPKVAISRTPLNVGVSSGGFEWITNYSDIEYSQTKIGSSSAAASHEIIFMDLVPATTYYYAIVILGTPTPIAGWSGSFQTKSRHVAVTYGTILVADDTDDFGTGELAFRYQIFHPSTDFWQPNVSLDHVNDPPSGYYDLASGDAYWPIVTLHSGPLDAESIVVAISALEDDAPWYYGTNHAGDQFRGTGSNDDYEWNSAAVGVALPGITLVNPVAPTLADAEEFYTEIAIHVTETDDTCLEYSVFVGVHMTYQ